MIEKLQNKSKIPDYLKSQLDTLNEKTLQKCVQGMSNSAYAQAADKLKQSYEMENGFAVNTEFLKSDDILDVDHNARQMLQTRRAFYKELSKVVETADVIL